MAALLTCLWLLLPSLPAQQPQVMTTAPNVRLRATPDLNGEVVREEPLASVHNVEARVPGGWLKVGFGYLREELTAPFTSADRVDVLEKIVRAQLQKEGAGFEAWNQVLALTGRYAVRSADRETQARFALYELQALRGAADAAGGLFRTPFAFRLGDASDVFVNHEPAGQWIIRHDYIVAVHDEFKDTAAADDILWFAAENGLPGECEGDPSCYATLANRLYGEYLRRYPSGRHVDAAIEEARLRLHHSPTDLAQAQAYREGCPDLRKQVAALTAAVTATASPRREAFRQAAEAVTAICR